MFEKYTVIKAVISTKVLLRQLHKAKSLVNSKSSSELYKTLVFKFELIKFRKFFREFDPGSGRTLAACLTHASRARIV